MSRYSNIEYIYSQSPKYVLELYQKAVIEKERETLFQLYLCDRPNMDSKTNMSFIDYYEKYRTINFAKAVKCDKTEEEIIAESLQIQHQIELEAKRNRKE